MLTSSCCTGQPRPWFGTITLLLLSCIAGCAVPIRITDINRDVPHNLMPALVQSGVDTLGDPQMQKRLQRLLADPQVQAMQKALVAGLVDGTLATLSDRERAERIGALATQAVTGIIHGATRELGAGLSDAAGSAVDSALSPQRRRALEGLITAVVMTTFRAAVAGLREAELSKSLASAVTQDLGPALHKSLREDLAPGLAELLRNEELNQALGKTARRLGREMVLGATEGLAQTQQPKEDGSLLSRATELAHQGARLFGTAAWLLVAIIIALLVWTLKLRTQARSYREEAARRAAATHLLAEASKAAEGKPWADELLDALQERLAAQDEAIAALQQTRGSAAARSPAPRNGHTPPAAG